MNLKLFYFIILLGHLAGSAISAEDIDKNVSVEKESELMNFNAIKSVLKNDNLEGIVEEKKKEIIVAVKKNQQAKIDLFRIPGKDSFWSFFSEYWLVKKAPALKWDFPKPDYGLDDSFAFFLEKLGHLEKSFKILLIDTPNLTHAALPANRDEYILLISLPFIRTLDLSKLEISLLLFEDFLRIRMNYFEQQVSSPELEKLLGSSFYNQKFDTKIWTDLLNKYDDVLFKTGFSFQEQFEVTKQMGDILKNDLKLWNAYVKLLQKIDGLVKSNVLYGNYVKIYPSPELQLNWLTLKPKKL